MSVKIRLNNKKFLGESLLIGSRLYEGQVPNNQAVTQPTAQPTAQPTTQPVAQPVAQPTAQPATQSSQGQNANQQNQQMNIAQQLQQVYIKHFQGLQAAIANDLKTIQGIQWAQNIQPKDQSFNSIMAALQEYMKANVEVAKKVVEAAAQQGQGSNMQNASTNASAGQ